MKNTLYKYLLILVFITFSSFILQTDCNKKVILNKIEKNKFSSTLINSKLVPEAAFKRLNSEENKSLWYEEIQFPKKTPYTSYWCSYGQNYNASNSDFINHFKLSKNVDLAFQFGPNMDLWAYHIFTIKKMDCYYLATRSYFRHARFTYKAYSLLTPQKLDSLILILNQTPKKEISKLNEKAFGYVGVFQDNINNSSYFIDFENETDSLLKTEYPNYGGQIDTVEIMRKVPIKEISDLYEFVDNKIEWIESYNL